MPRDVLVATPQTAFGELIRLSLEESGKYSVRITQNSHEALENSEHRKFDLVILDHELPGEPLVAVCRSLRENNPAIRIVLIPPENDQNHPLVSELQADDCLSRPFYLPSTMKMIDQLFDQALETGVKSEEHHSEAKEKSNVKPWLHDGNLLAQRLSNFLKGCPPARAAFTAQSDHILAYAGEISSQDMQELCDIVARHRSKNENFDLARFVRLTSEGNEYLLYAISVNDEINLGLVFETKTPISKARLHINQLAKTLRTPPPEWMIYPPPREEDTLPPLQETEEPQEIQGGTKVEKDLSREAEYLPSDLDEWIRRSLPALEEELIAGTAPETTDTRQPSEPLESTAETETAGEQIVLSGREFELPPEEELAEPEQAGQEPPGEELSLPTGEQAGEKSEWFSIASETEEVEPFPFEIFDEDFGVYTDEKDGEAVRLAAAESATEPLAHPAEPVIEEAFVEEPPVLEAPEEEEEEPEAPEEFELPEEAPLPAEFQSMMEAAAESATVPLAHPAEPVIEEAFVEEPPVLEAPEEEEEEPEAPEEFELPEEAPLPAEFQSMMEAAAESATVPLTHPAEPVIEEAFVEEPPVLEAPEEFELPEEAPLPAEFQSMMEAAAESATEPLAHPAEPVIEEAFAEEPPVLEAQEEEEPETPEEFELPEEAPLPAEFQSMMEAAAESATVPLTHPAELVIEEAVMEELSAVGETDWPADEIVLQAPEAEAAFDERAASYEEWEPELKWQYESTLPFKDEAPNTETKPEEALPVLSEPAIEPYLPPEEEILEEAPVLTREEPYEEAENEEESLPEELVGEVDEAEILHLNDLLSSMPSPDPEVVSPWKDLNEPHQRPVAFPEEEIDIAFPWEEGDTLPFDSGFNAATRPMTTPDIFPPHSHGKSGTSGYPPAYDLDETRPVAGDLMSMGYGSPYELPVQNEQYYTCILLTRVPGNRLRGDLSQCIKECVQELCKNFGWNLDGIAIRPEYLQWTMRLAPAVSPGNLVRIIRKKTSERILGKYPGLRAVDGSDDFWAPGYMIIRGALPPTQKALYEFINHTRKRQGYRSG